MIKKKRHGEIVIETKRSTGRIRFSGLFVTLLLIGAGILTLINTVDLPWLKKSTDTNKSNTVSIEKKNDDLTPDDAKRIENYKRKVILERQLAEEKKRHDNETKIENAKHEENVRNEKARHDLVVAEQKALNDEKLKSISAELDPLLNEELSFQSAPEQSKSQMR